MITSKILAHSVNPVGVELITVEATYPRFIHSELMTHRMFSRNSASSRAIPVEKMIQRIETDPAIPISWGLNQPGMQANSEADYETAERARAVWLLARTQAVANARILHALGIHKQIVNRIVEPWMNITVIISATEWSNFFALRDHKDAEPNMRALAVSLKETIAESKPIPLKYGEWHLPLTDFPGDESLSLEDKIKVSVGRCARISYLTHDGQRDVAKDIELHDRLKQSGHWSPFEHVAQATEDQCFYGNFRGFKQYRKICPGECI